MSSMFCQFRQRELRISTHQSRPQSRPSPPQRHPEPPPIPPKSTPAPPHQSHPSATQSHPSAAPLGLPRPLRVLGRCARCAAAGHAAWRLPRQYERNLSAGRRAPDPPRACRGYRAGCAPPHAITLAIPTHAPYILAGLRSRLTPADYRTPEPPGAATVDLVNYNNVL